MELRDFGIYKSSDPTSQPNKLLIPVNRLAYNDEDVEIFNAIYQYCLHYEALGELGCLKRTRSGGISTARENLHGAMWLLNKTKSIIEIIIRNFDARYYRFIIGQSTSNELDDSRKNKAETSLSGRQAFILYKDELQAHGIDLEALAVPDGIKIKETIPPPRIELCCTPDRTYINVHHIDLNAAYNSGMMMAFPVLEPAIRTMYEKRQFNKKYKDILNMTQGFMQSSLVGYRFAHISKAGYDYTLKRLDELTQRLGSEGYKILCYNTDGIWYTSKDGTNRRYSDSDEGYDLCQWKHDYINCKIRFKSKGCYEFIGTNTKDNTEKYHPVFRGTSTFEQFKPRSEWEWGDIYLGEVLTYVFVEGEGLVRRDILGY